MRKLWLTSEIRGLNFTKDEVNNSIENDKPLLLTLYTKSICNAKCPSCYITSEDESYDELKLEKYINIISEAFDLGIKTIKFSGAGEPLIVPEIIDILKECFKYGIVPVIYTNGSVLGNDELCNSIYGISSEEFIQKLYDLGCSIVYKCNSMKSEVQDELLGVKGMSRMTYKGLLNLMFMEYNKDCRLALQTIITPFNYGEVKQLYSFARRHYIIPYFETVLKKGDAGLNNKLYLTDDKIKEIFLCLAELDKREFGLEWFPVPSYVNFQCTELGYAMLIDNFGHARICPGIWEPFGNVYDKNIETIWNSKKMIEFRKRVNMPMDGKCNKCIYKEEGKCGYGCRAYAYLNDGNMFGEYSECWW